MSKTFSKAEHIASQLDGKPAGDNWWRCKCPVHNSAGRTLALKDLPSGGTYIICHGGCPPEKIDDKLEELGCYPEMPKCTLANYAAMLQVSEEFLQQLGVRNSRQYGGSIAIPYVTESGKQSGLRFRIALSGRDKFMWEKGAKPCLYGLSKLGRAAGDKITIVEGESDCHILWWEGYNALGLPGGGNWNETRDAHHLDSFSQIYVVIEPDGGGEAMLKWLAASSIRDRVHLISLPEGCKDPRALYQASPERFGVAWDLALANAIPWRSHAEALEAEARNAAKQKAARLLAHPDILEAAVSQCSELGVSGEAQLIKVTYLVVTTRILDAICSLLVKGPSSAGKSFIVEQVLSLFPASSYIARSSMSERALIYSDEPLSHRMLVLYEATGLSSEFLTDIVRSLLSEGQLKYETVEKGANGQMHARLIEKQGPTGLILTTTELAIHPENETRCLSIAANDTPEQTAAIMKRIAEGRPRAPDLSEWHALQEYLALGRKDVEIPYAITLAGLIKPSAIRLRRDFRTLLALIKAHALLHQEQRQRDEEGVIIATLEDYAIVSRLVNGLISDTAEVSVPESIRKVRQAVADLLQSPDPSEGDKLKRIREAFRQARRQGLSSVKLDPDPYAGALDGKATGDTITELSVKMVAKALKLDSSTAWRHVRHAIKLGHLKNLEDRRGKQARIVLGDEIPDEIGLLPLRDQLEAALPSAP